MPLRKSRHWLTILQDGRFLSTWTSTLLVWELVICLHDPKCKLVKPLKPSLNNSFIRKWSWSWPALLVEIHIFLPLSKIFLQVEICYNVPDYITTLHWRVVVFFTEFITSRHITEWGLLHALQKMRENYLLDKWESTVLCTFWNVVLWILKLSAALDWNKY